MFYPGRSKAALVIAANSHILYHAISALQHFQQSFESTTLVISASSVYREQVLEIARRYPWADVFSVNENEVFQKTFPFLPKRLAHQPIFRFVTEVLKIRLCNKFLKARFSNVSSVRLLVCGFYGHPVDITACTIVPHELFVLVDDGNMTREVANKRNHEADASFKRVLENNSTYKFNGLKGRIKLYSYRFFGHVKDSGSKSICFFTHYPDIIGHKNDYVIPIGLRFPFKKATQVGVVHVLGLLAIERQMIKPNDFADLLRWIAERYQGKIIHYFPHPGSTEIGRKFVESIAPDWIWHDSLSPYEEYFKNLDSIPEIVASFYSSVLFNLAAYEEIGCLIESLEIPLSMIPNSDRRMRVECIYEYAKRHPKIIWIPFQSLKK